MATAPVPVRLSSPHCVRGGAWLSATTATPPTSYTACPQRSMVDTFSENAVSVTDSAVAPGGYRESGVHWPLPASRLLLRFDFCGLSAPTSRPARRLSVFLRYAAGQKFGFSNACTSATDTIETRNSIEGLSALHTAAVRQRKRRLFICQTLMVTLRRITQFSPPTSSRVVQLTFMPSWYLTLPAWVFRRDADHHQEQFFFGDN